VKTCPWCGVEFAPGGSRSKYCSHSHRQMAYAQRKAAAEDRAAEQARVVTRQFANLHALIDSDQRRQPVHVVELAKVGRVALY
jgi:hypothetical protein